MRLSARRNVPSAIACAFILIGLAGCSPRMTSTEEFSFLYGTATDIEALKGRFAPLEGFQAADLDDHKVFFSHLHEPHPNAPVIMNRGNYWFKVSFSEEPVDAFDTPMPVWMAEIPSFNKFLKLQVRGADRDLTLALVEIVRRRASEIGAKNERLELTNAIEQPPRRRMRRRGF